MTRSARTIVATIATPILFFSVWALVLAYRGPDTDWFMVLVLSLGAPALVWMWRNSATEDERPSKREVA